jgi:D-beta-D-heptose 7-phosphate kinase/D-beta-D-heptose 1-phosphate adenosyltransferase
MRVVFTNGCFDIFHAGHGKLLARCIELLDDAPGALVVALNRDAAVRALKGEGRPVQGYMQRAGAVMEFCARHGRIPQIIPFGIDPYPLIDGIEPDFLVKGDDWSETSIIGAHRVARYGGVVIRVPRDDGPSTSKIIAQRQSAPWECG